MEGSTQVPQITEKPARIEMAARRVETAGDAGTFGDEILARLTVDPYANVVSYELDESVVSATVDVHGYMPVGWVGERLERLPAGSRAGSWTYAEEDERNLLAGLSYLLFNADGGDGKRRAQIEEVGAPDPTFEDYVTVTPMAGACMGNGTIAGVIEDVPMQMDPAQVIIGRTPAVELPDGRRQQEIGCAIRVGGARMEGVGEIEIGMFGHKNRGWIESMHPGSDFPAKMMLDVQKSYITPAGTFYRDKEEFIAENILRFPPFGVEFKPVDPIAPLYEVKTRERVGHVELKWLVPLCYVDPSSFPSSALSRAAVRRDVLT
jgi:hypothetical protein